MPVSSIATMRAAPNLSMVRVTPTLLASPTTPNTMNNPAICAGVAPSTCRKYGAMYENSVNWPLALSAVTPTIAGSSGWRSTRRQLAAVTLSTRRPGLPTAQTATAAAVAGFADAKDATKTVPPAPQPASAPRPAGQPLGAIQLLSGANAGKELELAKPLTTLGKPGVQVAVLTRRPQGYFITHVEGAQRPTVNGQAIGTAPHALKDHDLVEIAGDDLLHQLLHQLQEGLAVLVVEVVECHRQRGDAVDEAAHRMATRREERRIAQRGTKHRQLQPSDLARHLRRHFGIRQDLVEQAADHVDHHVVERAGGGLAQLVAVGDDQVGAGQAGGTGLQVRDRAAQPAARCAAVAHRLAELIGEHRIRALEAGRAGVGQVVAEQLDPILLSLERAERGREGRHGVSVVK